MKQVKLITATLFMSFFVLSCGNNCQEQPKEEKEIVGQEEHHHDDKSETIQHNNGEKWKVDDAMLIHIRNMESDVISFSNTEQKDFKSLSDKLKSNIDLLTSNCTMTGQAHDELHKWLLPYIDLVDMLSEAKSETEAANQFVNIQTSFTTFNQFFQ